MKKRFGVIVVVGIVVFACGSKEHSRPNDEISGTYVREYSFKVVNPETGAEIGMRTVRDTIFITPVDERFEVSNHKWAKNDYDNEGWRNMEHADDRPIPTYQAVFAKKDSSLICTPRSSIGRVFLDFTGRLRFNLHFFQKVPKESFRKRTVTP